MTDILAVHGVNVLKGNALAVGAMAAWAISFPAAEFLLPNWDALMLTTLRFALALAFIVPLWAMAEGWRAVWRAPWVRGILVGAPTFGCAVYLLLVSQSLTDAVTAAILAVTMPIAGAAIEVVTGARKLRLTFVFGLALSLIGGLVATGSVQVNSLGLGALAMLVSVFLYALGSYFSVRSFPELSPYGRSALPLMGGLVLAGTAVVALQLTGHEILPQHRIDGAEIGLILIYTMVGLGLSQVLWVASVGHLGVAVASIHVNATPFYVMLTMVILGAAWNWQQPLGAAIVIAGVVVAQKRRRSITPPEVLPR
ncbi:DMT family transporter [Cognatishimia sp. WU-CL00825]|uniref:DMT family transporter n=1 Tax=Cognatishimia sp. WU-CL00825 TaxID=3127658 RepID=UPI00310B663A